MTEPGHLSTVRTPLRSRAWLPMLIVLLAFFAFWLWDLGYPALSGDEAFVANFAPKPLGEIFQRLNSDEPHPPFYYLLMHGWSLAAGERPEFIVRFPSLLFGLLLLSLTYRLGRDLGLSSSTALLPVVLMGFLPHVLIHLREARMYGLMLVSTAVLMLAALHFEKLPRNVGLVFAGGAAALALFTHYFNVLFVAAIGIWGVFALHRELRRRWVISQGIAWILFAIWLPLFGRGFFNPSSLTQGKTWSLTLPPWEAIARIVKTAVFGYRDSADVGWLILGGVLLVGGAVLGAFYFSKPKRGLLLLCIALPLLVYVLLGWFKPIFHPKYVLPWLLFAALAWGGLIARRRWLGGMAYLGLLALMIVPMYWTMRRPYDPYLTVPRHDWLEPIPRELGQAMQRLFGPTDVFAMGTPDVAHCYYSRTYFDRNLGCELIPSYPNQSAAELGPQLDELLSQHQVLWYLDFYNPAWDPGHAAQTAFEQRAVALGEENLAGRKLELYTSPTTIQRNLFPIAATFDNRAELQGIWLTAGRDLHLALGWKALVNQPPLDAKVFVHLIDAAGQIVAQQDGIPVHWTRPFSSWQQGEELLDVYTLPLPDGIDVNQLSLRVGLYNPDTGSRITVATQSGERLPDDAVVIHVRDALSRSDAKGEVK